MSSTLETVRSFLVLAFGFGFVVFWHELGHFLAAKWAKVKVEQFAVGFGQAVFAWRRGLGVRFGSTNKEYKRRIEKYLEEEDAKRQRDELQLKEKTEGWTDAQYAKAAEALGLGETEYRLNWIPLGGYVKMLGQDDLKPNSEADDPCAYNRQTIGKRMVIVSAGVVMNVILAAIGFMVLFMIGFHVPPATVGAVVPQSPAQQATADRPEDNGLRPGDRILTVDGRQQRDDWTKVQLYAALSGKDEDLPIEVERGGRTIKLNVRPRKGAGPTKEILGLGIAHAYDLKTAGGKEFIEEWNKRVNPELLRPELLTLKPGEQVVAINLTPKNPAGRVALAETDYVAFDRALQDSQGRPVEITVRTADGKEENRTFRPQFAEPFDPKNDPLTFAGMLPRVQVEQVVEGSPVINEKATDPSQKVNLKPGDVITAVITGKDKNTKADPTVAEFKRRLNDAGQATQEVELEVLRGGVPYQVHHLTPIKLDPDTYGLKIGIGNEQDRAVVSEVREGSAAAKAKVPAGARVVEVAGQPVEGWNDVYRAMVGWLADHPAADGTDPAPLPIRYETAAGDGPVAANLPLSAAEAKALAGYRFHIPTLLPFEQPRTAVRREGNPLKAASQGVVETRDFILQFYVTLRRMVSGDVGVRNMMGPVGIFQAGTSFASKGNDWLIWFLAMISANLAVVNFLPIPIVDGGLFTFLILEKIKGKPLSPKAMAIAQYVGMALLLGIFLFVTYQDIMWFKFR